MQHATRRSSRRVAQPLHDARSGTHLERFAIRFAEAALLAGIVGAGIVLLLAQAG